MYLNIALLRYIIFNYFQIKNKYLSNNKNIRTTNLSEYCMKYLNSYIFTTRTTKHREIFYMLGEKGH
jgi:hypothetical protein